MQGVDQARLQVTSDEFVAKMKEYELSNKWEKAEDKPVVVYKMDVQDRVAIKVQIKMNLNIDIIGEFFSNPLWIKVMSDDVKKSVVLFDNKNLRVINTIIKLPGPISDRQTVVVHTFKREGVRIITGNRSCDYFKHQKDSSTELATSHAVGFIIDKIDENTTNLLHISDMDPNGSIPNFIKNGMIGKRAEMLSTLEGKIKQWAKSKGK